MGPRSHHSSRLLCWYMIMSVLHNKSCALGMNYWVLPIKQVCVGIFFTTVTYSITYYMKTIILEGTLVSTSLLIPENNRLPAYHVILRLRLTTTLGLKLIRVKYLLQPGGKCLGRSIVAKKTPWARSQNKTLLDDWHFGNVVIQFVLHSINSFKRHLYTNLKGRKVPWYQTPQARTVVYSDCTNSPCPLKHMTPILF